MSRFAAYELRSGRLYHPTCFARVDAPLDGSPTRGKPIEFLHPAWPEGRACAECGGTSAEPKGTPLPRRPLPTNLL